MGKGLAGEIRPKLERLSRNLWWAWNPSAIEVFRQLDPELWRAVGHKPIAFLREISDETIAARAEVGNVEARIDAVDRDLSAYLADTHTWGIAHAGPLLVRPVLYMCAEFGLHESLPLYSGGLGVLAGDHLKSASDLGIPLLGVSLLYHEGYLQQRLTRDGGQTEAYPELDLSSQPVEPALDRGGKPVEIEVPMGNTAPALRARVMKLAVGRTSLLLLDPDLPVNPPEHRALARRLYAGDLSMRIRQEILLGVGGLRAVRALGIEPGVMHLNEGHSAFAVLEAVRYGMAQFGLSFLEARERAISQTVFTTHTPVEAGHDRFPPALVTELLDPIRREIGLSEEGLLDLGRVRPQDPTEGFTMTVLALRSARRSNGVSAIHGAVSRRMWQSLWPTRTKAEVPIGHITNGVHAASWMAPELGLLYDRHLRAGWNRHIASRATWERADAIPDEELWEVRRILKGKLVRFVRRRLAAGVEAGGLPPELGLEGGAAFDEDALTIGFARRFAMYKRADLLFRDPDRLRRLVSNPDRPVQIVFAGKAHPQDTGGKDLIHRIVGWMADAGLQGRIAFLPNHDMNVGRHLVQGVDLWLNCPRRPLEACGTSGQKVVLNGGLNCSILDGWYPEGYDGQNGFAIGGVEGPLDAESLDVHDSEALYRVLEEEVVPCFHDRDAAGIPRHWLARVKRSIRTLGWRFSMDREVIDYVRECYLPASQSSSCSMPPGDTTQPL